MSEQVDETKSKPWQWPGEWMRDEKFWKDVASRTFSGVLAIGLVYIYGLAVGYFQTPVIVGTTLMAIGAGGMFFIVVALFIFIYKTGFKKVTGHEKFLRKFELAIALSGALAVIGTVFLTASGALSDFPDLFGDFLNF